MKELGIKYQLRLTTLIPVLLVALLFAVFFNGEFNKDLNQHMSRLGEAYIRQLLPAAQLAMMRNDRRVLQALVDASTVNPEIIALAFYSADGQLIAYRGGKHLIKKPFKPLQYTGDYIESKQIEPYEINFLAPITIPKHNLYSASVFQSALERANLEPDDILGWLSIDIDTQSSVIKQYQMYIVTIFIILLGLLLSLSIHYFLSKRIYLPLARLRRSMKQILSNEFETHISVTSPGELGIIERGCAHLQQQYLNTVRDLNHHIEVATEDLQQSLELLEEKNIELSLEKKKTEEKSRQKSEFIANMSHEIRTPMNGVIGFTNVLLESKLDPLQLDYVKTIKSSAQDLLTIINDILDYSKMDAGKLSLDCIPLDLRACVDEVLTLAAPNAHKKGIDLIPSTEVNVPKTVLGDPIRIKQILTNLVTNAVKFTDRGYVLVKTCIEQETEKDYLFCISVIDTGMGISSDDQTKLFNAFNQADTTITRRFGGSGLGLVICKKLAEEMKGRITLTSELHKGSTFAVRIRLEKLTAYESEKHQAHRFENIKAICYDDNPLHLEAMCNGLVYCGIQCVPVASLSELDKALATRNDCTLAFVNVDEDCEEKIAGILRKYSIASILISKSIIHEPQRLGARGFLFRPISIQKLHDTIESLINPSQPAPAAVNHELDNLRGQLRLSHPDILIAEDNPVNRMLLHSFLNEIANVEAVNDGEEAVLACCEKHYQLILLDWQMPKLGGLDAAKRIRHESSLNITTPIVVISADESAMSEEKLKKAGIDLYLQKPVEEKELLSALLSILRRSKPAAIDWALCVQKVSGNQALAKEFLGRFMEELRENRKEFIQLYHDKNVKGLGTAAHKLHGACCFCGVPNLQAQVTRLETHALKAKHVNELESVFAQLIQSIDEVLDEFENIYQTSSSNFGE
ncbi:two-component system sensor histidine kinase LetS [Legionella taurinensis]|uniref:histidine kinase n=1 Tax=Legionella taurinensis TaxID=70611 RepID=A0A3A5LJ30_9GAMM|nr:response regulator [Legionella taurinensis]RJT47967.1 response regulator [Legionella taurinensis]RJT68181.1 response regulator [Legionella taurinensis]STY25641.1 sensory box histidine kinase/response regulator [Legionella taurinensis]